MPAATSPRILIVEDDPSVREAVGGFLGNHGFLVTSAQDAKAADCLLADQRYDLILLDVMLPGEDGLSMCRRLAGTGCPILIVSAMGSTVDRIVGLELGAADYLPKPFEPRELLARIRAVLRSHERPRGEGSAERLTFAGLNYDPDAAMLTDPDGILVGLTAGEIRLLDAFLARSGRLLSRNMLMDLTHGDGGDGPYDRAVDLAVSRLRRKLVAAGAVDPIETVRGAGYRFVAKVERR